MIAIGQVISGKYRLLRLLGDGGMGSVYEATHEMLGTRVAIKVLHADLARRTGLVDRFLQEARVSAQIQSPHVVRVMDVDRTADGVAYIVMELLEGEPLSAMLDRQGKLPIAIACDYTMQILSALEAAHALGVVHRDLKPENVFVTFAGARPMLKLIDFGIAKLKRTDPGQKNLTVAGVLMGTAEYMAPEQAYSADRADARSDLYAVGVMLFEMIAGQRPVAGEDARIIALKVERGEVAALVHVAPEAPRELAGLVHRAMAARPELRFASATEMRLALEGALSGKRVQTVPLRAVEAGATGTMQGAPAAEVLAAGRGPSHAAQGPHLSHAGGTSIGGERDTPPPNTERAPPVPAAFTPPPAPIGYTPSALSQPSHPGSYPRARPRRGGVPMWLLVVLPLLLGAGVVGVLVYNASDREPSPLTPSATDTSPPTATLTSTTPTAAPPSDSVAPLIPSPRAPASPTPQTPPKATGAPSGALDASRPPPAPSGPSPDPFPPFTIPSTLPFPMPSAPGSNTPFPFPLPSGFPTSLPFPLPGAPQPAPSAPATAAPSGRAL